MTGGLYRLGRICVRRRWIVLAGWLLVFAVLAVFARSLGPNVSDNLTLPGTDSNAATNLLEQRFPSQANGINPVVLRAPHGEKITASKFKTPIDDTVKALKADPDVRSATSPLSSDGKAYLAKQSGIGYIALNLKPSPSELSLDDANRLVALADPARNAGLEVGFGGYLGQKVSKPDTHSSEVIGLGMAVIVLLFTFGTVVAMGLPIFTALIGLVCGLSFITLLSHVAIVPTVAPTLATMIGLGVGIDYALFIVTRHLEQRRDGMETGESIARATASSGGAVVFAGSTVMVALLSLAVVGIPLVTTLGYTSALVVVVAVLGAITLLPAILGIVGDRIDRLRLPLPHHGRDDHHPHGWLRWGRFVAGHPVPSALVALVVLAVLALPALDLYLGQQDNRAMPESTDARRASDGLTTGFGPGTNGPLLVSVDLSKQPAKADQKQIDKVNSGEQDNKDKANKQAQQQEQEIAAQLEAQGVPPARGAVTGAGPGPAAARQAARPDLLEGVGPAQEGRAAGDRSAAAGPARRSEEDGRRQVGDRAAGQQGRHRRGAQPHADDRSLRPRDRGPRHHAARRHDPEGRAGQRHERRRRRPDGGLRRPRGRDQQPAHPHHRRRGGAQLRAAAARVPLDRDPAHRGLDEPRLDRRRVRRGDRGVREGLGRGHRRVARARCRSCRSCR